MKDVLRDVPLNDCWRIVGESFSEFLYWICEIPYTSSKQHLKNMTDSHWSRRKFSTYVQLTFCLATHLCWLWSSSNSYASRHKLIANHLAWNLRLFVTCVNLRVDLRIRLATHRKVRTQVLVLRVCVDVRVRLARALDIECTLWKRKWCGPRNDNFRRPYEIPDVKRTFPTLTVLGLAEMKYWGFGRS